MFSFPRWTARFLTTALVLSNLSIATAQSPADSLHALFDEAWAAEQEWDPIAATNRGNHDFNHRLPDVSPAAFQSRHQARKSYLDRLRAIDRSQLGEEDRLNFDLFEFRLEQDLSEDTFQLWRIPFNSDSGLHTELALSVEATRFESVSDYEAYLTRLTAIPAFVDQQIANMRQGLAAGFTQPKLILGNVEPTFAALAVESPE
ncbi:MAG TPA: DUF885 family protein, partial [Rhodothermia bacterium]|nr:DUF885 family protein [Rhodothermia bacterium]